MTTIVPADVRDLFEPDLVHLNTASAELPVHATSTAVHDGLDRWRSGELQAPDTDATIVVCRDAFAALMGVDGSDATIASQAPALIAPIAAAVPTGRGGVGVDALHAHEVTLVNAFAPASVSPAVMRAGLLRLSFHLYIDRSDVDAALGANADHVRHD